MTSTTPPIQPIRPAYHTKILADDQLQALKHGTLEIIAEVGVHCPSQKALEIYADHGAVVDFDTKIVKLPHDLVLDSMSRAPRYYTMAARNQSHDLVLDGTSLYCATDGCGVETIDFISRQRRNSTKDDVAISARIADYCSSIGFYWPMVSAQDHPQTAPLHEIDAAYNNTIKHIQTETVMDEVMARYAVEMAKVIAGDSTALRDRPPLSSLICTIAPLAQDEGGMEAALVFADAGIPVGFMSMANVGSTGPATLAGTLIAADAEIVAALVLIQLAYPGAPVYHSMMPGIMHPRTGAYLATAWQGEILYPIGVEMAHQWGVPTLAGVFGTDGRVPGWQSAAESAAYLALCATCGAETGAGLGLLESCNLLYPEALLLDTDIYHKARHLVAGLDTSQSALAIDVIKDVGPRGHFLRHKHTREHLRNIEFSSLTAQPGDGFDLRDPIDVAKEQTDWIIQNHFPEPIDNERQNELKNILSAAEEHFGK